MGEYGRAIPDLDRAIRLEPFNSATYLNRGVARLYLGRANAAIEDFPAPPHRGLARETLTLLVDGVPQELEVIRQERYLGGSQGYWCCGQCSALRSHLYVVDGVLACRVCLRLTYRSRALQRHRAVLRVAKLRKRLGAEPSLLSPIPPKPPRWRHARYNHLVRELAAQEAIVVGMLGGIVRDLKRRKGRLHGPR